MASFDYNPITGQLDLVGSGGGTSYIDGVVADSSLLPTTLGSPALDAVYLAKAGSGVWLINRKPAGLYVRVANNGVAADWQYLGAFPEVNADGNWELYNSTDPTKELKFDLSGLPTATVRTVSAPAGNGQMLVEGQPIGNTTPNSGAFTTLDIADGARTALSFFFRDDTNTGFYRRFSDTMTFVAGGANRFEVAGSQFKLDVNQSFGWTFNDLTGSMDLTLVREGAGILAQRTGTSPQTFNIYNTSSSGNANHERGFLRWSSNVLQIGTEAAGTGTVRNIEFVVPVRAASYRSTTTWIDFADASSGPRMGVYSHGGVLLRDSGYWGWHSAAGLTSGSTGDLRMYRSGAGILRLQSDTSDFNRIQFGGTTTSFPALKRDTTKLQARLADDSDFTAIQGKLTTETAYTAGAPTATGYLVLYDSNGTAYKVPAEAL